MFGGSGVGRKGGLWAMVKAPAFCPNSIADSVQPVTHRLSVVRFERVGFIQTSVMLWSPLPVG
jgi:hypothetical protein